MVKTKPSHALQEEQYRCIAYANGQFATNVSEWKTDRVRIYIIYGAPNSVESSHRLSPPNDAARLVVGRKSRQFMGE